MEVDSLQFVSEERENHAPHSAEGMHITPEPSDHDLMRVSTPQSDQAQVCGDISPFDQGQSVVETQFDLDLMNVATPQLDQCQAQVDISPFDQGQLGVALQFQHGLLGVASQFNQGHMGSSMPQFVQGHGKISAPLRTRIKHPVIKQAEEFLEYQRMPADGSRPPPRTTFAWFLQQMDISRLGFSAHHKNVLQEYLEVYEQTMAAGVMRV